MIRFLTDENFNGHIVRGIYRQRPDADIVRVQDTEIYTARDQRVLAWAAEHGRILLTHDVKTMPDYANDRIAKGLPMPGVIVVHDTMLIGKAVNDLLTVLGASEPGDWENLVEYLPL